MDGQAMEGDENTPSAYSNPTLIVEHLLRNFLIGSESAYLDDINLVLMMKALPSRINKDNVKMMKMFNFNIFENSLISF